MSLATRNLLLRPIPPRVVATDDFERADSALTLSGTTTGQTWTIGNLGDQATLPVYGIASLQAYSVSLGSQNEPHAWVETSATDVRITATVTVPTAASSQSVGFIVRRAGATSYYVIRINNGTDTIDMVRNVAGTRTSSLASTSITLADDQVIAIEVLALGGTIQVRVDGILKIKFNDNQVQGTKHGLAGGGTSARWNNLRIVALR